CSLTKRAENCSSCAISITFDGGDVATAVGDGSQLPRRIIGELVAQCTGEPIHCAQMPAARRKGENLATVAGGNHKFTRNKVLRERGDATNPVLSLRKIDAAVRTAGQIVALTERVDEGPAGRPSVAVRLTNEKPWSSQRVNHPSGAHPP